MSVSYRFPGDRSRVLTFSYDDGAASDRRLVDILTRFGMKATFNLNAFSGSDRITPSEYRSLYTENGHEIACHGVSHPFPEKESIESFVNEIRDNRIAIEDVIQIPVKGFAYPCGIFDDRIKTILHSLGIVYARTVRSTGRMHCFPGDWLEWDPTAHHSGNLKGLAESFLNPFWTDTARMLYVWGHSSEFERDQNWNVIEDFCKCFQGNDDVWRATNMEIYEYIEAFHRLQFTADCSIVKNPSSQTVWVRKDGVSFAVGAGETVVLK